MKKLLANKAILKAYHGACLFTSRIVTTAKIYGSIQMFVDYHYINAQNEKISTIYNALIRFGHFCHNFDT